MSNPLQPAACLDARAHAPLAFPGFGAIAGLGVAPHQRCLALGVAHPHIVCGPLDLPIQHLVGAETKNTINAVGLTPRHGLVRMRRTMRRMWPRTSRPDGVLPDRSSTATGRAVAAS